MANQKNNTSSNEIGFRGNFHDFEVCKCIANIDEVD
jgi:hypothetical protein